MNDMPEMSDRRVWGYSRYPRRAVFISARPVSSNEAEENRKPESPHKRFQRPQQIAEASVGANELKAFIEWVDSEDKSGKDWTVALLSFYTDGVSEIRKVLQKRFGAQFEGGEAELGVSNRVKVKIATIDAVQGREADVVLLHVGNSKLTSFTKSINRVNVALTRARYQLVVIGNRSDLARSGDTYLLSNLARNDEIFWAHGV
jgi:superfamily I DNA and/or RNA helicase